MEWSVMTMDGSTKRIVTRILLGTLLIWFLLWITGSSPSSSSDRLSEVLVDYTEVNYQNYPKMTVVYGKVAPLNPVNIDAEITASIDDISVDNGSYVKAGDTIAQFDTTDLKITQAQILQQVEKIKSTISQSQDEILTLDKMIEHDEQLLSNAQDMLDRYLSLSDRFKSQQGLNQRQDAVSDRSKSLINNQKQRNNLEHKLDQLKSDLVTENMRYLDNAYDLEHSSLTSPIDGYITDLTSEVGDLLQKGAAFCQIIDPNNTYINAFIPAQYYRDIAKDQSARLVGEDYQLTLKHMDNVIDDNAAHLDAQFYYDDTIANLPIGQVVTLALSIPQNQDSFRVPESAIYEETYVYLIESNELRKQPIDILGQYYEKGETYYLIRHDDIVDGAQILTSRLARPRTGLRVRYA